MPALGSLEASSTRTRGAAAVQWLHSFEPQDYQPLFFGVCFFGMARAPSLLQTWTHNRTGLVAALGPK